MAFDRQNPFDIPYNSIANMAKIVQEEIRKELTELLLKEELEVLERKIRPRIEELTEEVTLEKLNVLKNHLDLRQELHVLIDFKKR